MSTLNLNKKGVSIIFAVFTLLLLSVIGVAISSMISSDIETAANKVVSARAFWAAEAGLQVGAQAIRNDVEATINGTNDPASPNFGSDGIRTRIHLEGYEVGGNGSNPQGACLWWGTKCVLPSSGTDLIMYNFRQRRNLIGTRITGLEIVLRGTGASRVGGDSYSIEGPHPIVRYEYSTDGGSSWTLIADNVELQYMDLSADLYGHQAPVSFPASINWDTFMQDNGQDFQIKVTRLDTNNYDLVIDCLFLRATVEVDCLTEDWYNDWMGWTGMPPAWTGEPISLPNNQYLIDNSHINSIKMEDESGKIHLNYASLQLLENLFRECGLNLGRSNELATNIVNYRATNMFDTVEELREATNTTDAEYDQIVQDVTIYSWINQDATRSTGARAPVNINTASENVLRAIFRCVTPALSADDITSLVGDIIARRSISEPYPFTHMYSSYERAWATGAGFSAIRPSFGGFLFQRTYLNADERNAILANADGSYFNTDLSQDWSGATDGGGTDNTATEFCYYSNAFLITAVGENGGIERTVVTTYGDSYNYGTYSLSANGTFKLRTHITDSSPQAYWRERR